MGLADELRADVVELLADDDFGMDASLSYTAPGTFDPLSGVGTPGAATDLTIRVSSPGPVESQYVDGDTVQTTDLFCITDAVGLSGNVPRPGLLLTVGGIGYTILSVTPFNVGGTVAAYGLAVRL